MNDLLSSSFSIYNCKLSNNNVHTYFLYWYVTAFFVFLFFPFIALSSQEIVEDLTIDYLGGNFGSSLIDDSHQSSCNSGPSSHFMRRQRSDLSDNFKISCSPEAESYFKRKAEALYDRACRGELDVEVHSDVIQEEGDGLRVLPIFSSDAFVEDQGGMEVTDLSEAPALEVKPVPLRLSVKRSSYESLYDAAKLENVVASEARGLSKQGDKIVLGDRFQGTFDKPTAASSFEKLYCEMPDDDWSVDVKWADPFKGDGAGLIGEFQHLRMPAGNNAF